MSSLLKWVIPVIALGAAMIRFEPLQAAVLERTAQVAGTRVQYKVVLPSGYDAGKTYPAILVFGGGPQTMNTVDGERIFPQFLDMILADYHVRDGKFHVAGPSNGGIFAHGISFAAAEKQKARASFVC